MNPQKKLSEFERKIITIEEMAKLFGISFSNTELLFSSVEDLINDGALEPVKNSGKKGNIKFPLYNKYRIVMAGDDYSDALSRIKKLHPILLKSGYLSKHPEVFVNNKDLIENLNAYLFSGSKLEAVSRKERSFEIFGREKVLDDSNVKSLLRNLQITQEDLKFYDTPEYCFHDYIPERKEEMTLLICENKDIWFNIRRCMFEDHYQTLFGVAIDGVVYGNGNKVSQKQGALVEYVKFMGNPSVHFLYWGDIDREGFDIFRRTREVNDALEISLFSPGYKKMIEAARNIELEDSPSSKKEGMDFDDLLDVFSPEEKAFLRNVFECNKLVPQEIIPYTLLSER